MRKIAESVLMEILLPDERVSLGLQHNMQKSSWQAGEIMGKSHYKYLEINYRATHFIKMFKEYLDLFGEIIPGYIQGDERVKKYLRLCIGKRMKPGDALKELGTIRKKQLDTLIIKTLADWSNPETPNEFYAFNLTKEFDRWNNFRILPQSCQEPSAYKRRVKNNYKRRVKMMGQLSPLAIEKIKQLCKVPDKNYSPRLYLPLISKNKPEVVIIKGNKRTQELATEINLYTFTHKKDAFDYIEAVHRYVSVTIRECTDGLEFWPKYRDLIKQATNYDQIQKITPSRKYLEMAMKQLEFYNQK